MNAERRPDLGANKDQREASAGPASRSPGAIELLGLERLEEHARRLAALFTVSWRPRGGSRVHLKRLRQHTAVLRQVYRALADDAKRGEPSSPAAEWLLDNFHVIVAALRDIHHDLPPGFFRRLPQIAADEFAGMPRIYAMALELIRTSAGRLDPQRRHRCGTSSTRRCRRAATRSRTRSGPKRGIRRASRRSWPT